MKFHFQFLIALAIAKVYSKQCGEGIGKCKNNYCCSKYGWCGTDDSYCGAGCQQEFGKCGVSTSTKSPENHSVSTDGRCGPNNNNTTCPKNQCCSKYGWCGTSSDYCDGGCQSEFGRCNGATSNTSTTSSATSSKPTNNSKPISTDDHCGPNYNNTYCPKNQCCSKYGWCGTSSDHCDGGCQSEFGRCNGVTSNTSTASSTTSTTSSVSSSKPTNDSKPISTDDHCGPDYNNTYCPNKKCCSKYGWCGSSEDHCGSGCQSEFGRCNNNDAYTNTSFPLSTDGRCGAEFGTRCPYGECCSQYGWCSSKDTHCNEGCQRGYGDCAEDINKRAKVYSKCINEKHWALTFDDGPFIYDDALLDYLKSVNIKATFFVIGHDYLSDNNRENKKIGKEIIKRMYEEGHEIENHTFNHLSLIELSSEKIIEEITQLENTIKSIINVKPAFIRPPYGEYDQVVQEAVQSLGYKGIILWNVDTLDWSNGGDSDYAIEQLRNHKGESVISLNHNRYSNMTKEEFIDYIKAEVEYMLEHGYTPVTMSECIGQKPYK